MSWFRRKAQDEQKPLAAPAAEASPETTVELRPPDEIARPGTTLALDGLHVTVEAITFREPPLRIRREHPGARWLMAAVAVENRGPERQRMPDLRVAAFDGSVGLRELCEEPGDFDGLYWLGPGMFVESFVFFALPGTAGGVFEAVGQDQGGPTGALGRWRFSASIS